MHADKHSRLMAAGPDVARLVLNAAVAHRVGVDDVVREAITRGDRPYEAKAALASLPEQVRASLAKMVSWPWDCPLCLDSVEKIESCDKGHLQCEACRQSSCPVCEIAARVTAERNARIAAEASAKLKELGA